MVDTAGFSILESKRIGGFWYLIGLCLGIYLQPFDQGFLKKTKISTALLFFVRWFFHILHKLEGLSLKALKKDPEIFRKQWVSNYVLVAQKIEKKNHKDG